MVPTMIIRDATTDEWPEVGELTHAAYVPLFDVDDLGRYGRELRDVAGRATHSDIIVAEHDGCLVGAVSYLRDYTTDPAMADLHAVAGVPGFRVLAVLPSAQGLGAGRALVDECLARARSAGARRLVIHTTDFMAVAQAMYIRMGFERYPEIDRWIGRRNPVHVKAFVLSLDGAVADRG